MSAIVETVWHGMLAASWIEQTATVLGLLGVKRVFRRTELWLVVLDTRRRPARSPAGFPSALRVLGLTAPTYGLIEV